MKLLKIDRFVIYGDTNVKKRCIRCKNFTEQEEENLLEIVSNFASISECKETDNINIKVKNDTWKKCPGI